MIYRRRDIGFRGTGWYSVEGASRLICKHPENKRLCISVGSVDEALRKTHPAEFKAMREWIEKIYRTGHDDSDIGSIRGGVEDGSATRNPGVHGGVGTVGRHR